MAQAQKQRIILEQAFFWVTPLVFLGGMLVMAIIGYLFAENISDEMHLGYTPVFTAIVLWISFYLFWGFKIVPNKGYLVIERFGEFNRIVHMGPRLLCFPGLIDKIIVKDGTLRNQEIELFKDEKPTYEVDFDDGSAPVNCKAWFHIGPKDLGTNCTEEDRVKHGLEIDEAIYKFTYFLKEEKGVKERIEDVLESEFVPLLQKLTIKQALVQKDAIADQASGEQAVIDALEAVGIMLCTPKGFVITDIVLPDAIIKLRQRKLEGEVEADKQAEQGLGYARTIEAIANRLKVSVLEAREIYETQRGLETLAGVNANVTFIARDIKDVQKTMGIDSGHRPRIIPAN